MIFEAVKKSFARVLWKVFGLGARCPYCLGTIYLWERPFFCERCMTAHHPSCWKEADHCAIFGCGAKEYYKRDVDQLNKDWFPWWWI